MESEMKKWIALALVSVLMLSLCANAFAVVLPTATAYNDSQNVSVKRGNTAVWNYKLNSHSYKKTNDVYRAKIISRAYKGNQRVSEGTAALFTGIRNYTVKLTIPTGAEIGKYKNWWQVYARTNAGKWVVCSTHITYWYVK